MDILVIDGQGGSMGRTLIASLLKELPKAHIVAVGTNAASTASMLKGGASVGATGENAVIYNAARCDVIIGPIGVIVPNAMYGEVSPAMAQAVGLSDARKILIPSTQCNVSVVGAGYRTLTDCIAEAVDMVKSMAGGKP